MIGQLKNHRYGQNNHISVQLRLMTVRLEHSTARGIPIKTIIDRTSVHVAVRLLSRIGHHSLRQNARNIFHTAMGCRLVMSQRKRTFLITLIQHLAEVLACDGNRCDILYVIASELAGPSKMPVTKTPLCCANYLRRLIQANT